MADKKPPKKDLIALLVEEGRGTHTTLQRLTLAGLQAMVDEIAEPKPATVAAKDVRPGMVIVGSTKRKSERKVGQVRIGKKYVTIFDTDGKQFCWAGFDQEVEVVS